MRRDPGSFRDPSGGVYRDGNRILRSIMPTAEPAYRAAKAAGLYDRLIARKLLLGMTETQAAAPGAALMLEHPRIDLISYPYEWCFGAHRDAALLHLDLHLQCLERGFTLSDASAYNVQFQGARPVFIDHLSIRPYRDQEIWAGHRQFCMQFLNPLLMHALLEVKPNPWFRGALEGIAPEDLAPLLPASAWLSWTILSHVVLQARLQKRQFTSGGPAGSAGRLSLNGFRGLINGLRSYIEGLHLPTRKTEWADYGGNNSYDAEQTSLKRAFVQDMVHHVQPCQLWDIGCNSGDFAVAALDAGAQHVIGWDFDHGALDLAYKRARRDDLPFLPLWMDAANPSPNQGWAEQERMGLEARGQPDALIALAFIHHIAIGRNVPLGHAVDWIIDRAPVGVIEFPLRNDAMVQKLLRFRDIAFEDYDETQFRAHVERRGRIVKTDTVASGQRLLVWYDRTQP